jgi:hypothetical protein
MQVTTQYTYIIASTGSETTGTTRITGQRSLGSRVWCKTNAACTQLVPNVTGSICIQFRMYYDRTLQQGRREYNGINVNGEWNTFILQLTVGWSQPDRALRHRRCDAKRFIRLMFLPRRLMEWPGFRYSPELISILPSLRGNKNSASL